MFWLVYFENYEENYLGPFVGIAFDSIQDDSISFLCEHADGYTERVSVPLWFQIRAFKEAN